MMRMSIFCSEEQIASQSFMPQRPIASRRAFDVGSIRRGVNGQLSCRVLIGSWDSSQESSQPPSSILPCAGDLPQTEAFEEYR